MTSAESAQTARKDGGPRKDFRYKKREERYLED